MSSSRPHDSQQQVRAFLTSYQDTLCRTLTNLDGQGHFEEDCWQKNGLGVGKTRILKAGDLFEHGGVNFSEIQSDHMPKSITGQHPHLAGQSFWGAGVSLVLHPLSPFCPTVHLNYRYFEAGDVWWFGGGCDLTPYYPDLNDCRHWHQTLKHAMDRHHPNYYPAFKYWCDEYFYNHHRQESRGIGGSFYDQLHDQPGPLVKPDHACQSADPTHPAYQLQQPSTNWQALFAFHQDHARAFFEAYLPIVERQRHKKWTEAQRDFQLYRRGRYVEFNLLHDRGTLFGIQSKGRIESILMSLPPLVRWTYNYQPPPNSPEARLTTHFLKRGIHWLDTTQH